MSDYSDYFGHLKAKYPHLEQADRVGKFLRADVETAFLAVQADMETQNLELVTVAGATVDADTIVAPADGEQWLVWDEALRTEQGPGAGDAFENYWAYLATWDSDEAAWDFDLLPPGAIIINGNTGHVLIFEILMGWIPISEAGGSIDGNVGKSVARATYDFDLHGGTVGLIILPAMVPPRAMVTRAYFHVDETIVENPVPGGATIDIGLLGGALWTPSLVGGAGAENFEEDTTYDTAVDGTAANMVLNGVSGSPIAIDIAVADLTAGKMTIFVEYQLLDDPIVVL